LLTNDLFDDADGIGRPDEGFGFAVVLEEMANKVEPFPARPVFAPLSAGSETGSSRDKIPTVQESATRRIGLVKFGKIPILYGCAPASSEHHFVSLHGFAWLFLRSCR
jgi:hypothetical protein